MPLDIISYAERSGSSPAVGRDGGSGTYLAVRVWSRERARSAVDDSEGCTCWFMEKGTLIMNKGNNELFVDPHRGNECKGSNLYSRRQCGLKSLRHIGTRSMLREGLDVLVGHRLAMPNKHSTHSVDILG